MIYKDLLPTIANQSKCKRLKVGAIIVKDKNIVAYGYNGTPHGWCNECEENGVTKPEVIHAEANAILKAARSTISTSDAIMYATHSCCTECAKMIIQSGIKEFHYIEQYRNTLGLEFLEKCGIRTYQI